MQESIPDLKRILKPLAEHGCRYVIIGGMAAVLHGSPLMTNDCDLAIYFDAQNRRNITEALRELNPRPLRFADRGFEFDEKCVVGPWTLLMTDAGRVDLIVRLTGVDNFEGLYSRAVSDVYEGIPFTYASLDDLIAMKEAAGRDKDQQNLEILRALRQIRAEE